MSDQSTEKVFFEIGVGEDPKATSALTALAAQIEKAQQQMLSGVQAIEKAAKDAEAAVGRAGSAAAKAGSSRPSMSFPTGTATMSNVPTMSRPPVSRMPAPFATVPAMSNVPAMGPASGRGTSSMPAPFATVPANTFNPPPGASPSASVPPSAAPPPSGIPSGGSVPSAASSAGVGPDAVERLDKFAKSADKAFKGVVDLGRGMALLGLVSEENSQKFLQSLVALEGVVSTLKGGADLAEGLVGMMRGGAGRAAGAAAASTAASAAGGGGFMSATVGGVGVGVAGTAAAAAAALASVSLVAIELKEIFSGTANEVGSVTDTIASWEVSMVSWMGEMTGWFDLVGNAATKEAEAKASLFKIEQERLDAIKGAELDAARQIEFGQAANNERFARFSAMAGVGTDNSLQAESAIYADSIMKFEQSQKAIAEMAAAGAEGTQDYADQLKRAEAYSAKIEQSTETIYQLEKAATKEKIDGAQKSIDLANKELDSRMKMLEALQEQRMTAAERFAALDDLQKGEAISALRQAQTQGATSLSDAQRSLLRSVGGDEANRFAREADIAEARAAGFDTSFGVGFDQQTARLEKEKAQFQAVIQEQNQIIINVEDRNKQIIENVVKEYGKVIQAENAKLEVAINKQLNINRAQINQTAQANAMASKKLNQ